MTEFPKLPCWPCPHHSVCCSWGTTLSEEEAEQVAKHHGAHLIYKTRWGEWRTRVKGKACVFKVGNGCAIHDKPYYPTVCRGFPWTDAETGGPYEYDQSICPEFVREPELHQLGLAVHHARFLHPRENAS